MTAMLEQPGLVIEVSNGFASVETQAVSSCSHCSSSDCSGSVLADLFTPKKNLFYVPNPVNAQPGEQVIIGIPESRLLSASILAYLLPLILMISVTALSRMAGASEFFQALLAIIALVAGLMLVNRSIRATKQNTKYEPFILRTLKQTYLHIDGDKLLRSNK